VSEKLDLIKERHIYNQFISNDHFEKNRNQILPFDMFPTILNFIGFSVPGGKLGLGYTALSKEADLSLLLNYEEMNEDLLNQSDMYLDLWRDEAKL